MNLLKQALLGEAHVGGSEQWELFSMALDSFGVGPSTGITIDRLTWKNWMSGAVLPQQSKLALLDEVLWRTLKMRGGSEYPSMKSDQRRMLISRIAGGQSVKQELMPPVGNLVRHLDAIDAGAWFRGSNESEWKEEKLKRANEVLMRLHSAWNPKSGWIYNSFRSDLKIEYDNSDSEGREEIRRSAALFTPSLYDHWMSQVPRPNHEFCERYSVLIPFSVVPFLLDISLDTKFLVEERLSTWAVDLASAAAALEAVWFAHRNETAGSIQLIKESQWLDGFEELFWLREFRFGMTLSRFGINDMNGEGMPEKYKYSRLLLARRKYHSFLRTYGISYDAIYECFKPQWEKWPVVLSSPARA